MDPIDGEQVSKQLSERESKQERKGARQMWIGRWDGWRGWHPGNGERGSHRMWGRTARLLAAGVVITGLIATAIAVASQVGVAHAADSLCGDGTRSQSGNTVTCTFSSRGWEQQFPIPAGVSPLTITAVGGRGGNGASINGETSAVGGYGAVVTATIPAPSATTLYVEVGGNALSSGFLHGSGDGFNGGGGGGGGQTTAAGAGGGGGASDVRTISNANPDTLNSRLVVAGGGGGGGMGGGSESTTISGGSGGNAYLNSTLPSFGANGGNGSSTSSGRGGAGATQTTGGSGGSGGSGASPGSSGSGGQLGSGGSGSSSHQGGGGGGGGYYGGGGGGSASDTFSPCCVFGAGGGGGGGSSYVEAGANDIAISLDTTGAPEVVISYTLSPAAQTTALLAEVDGLNLGQQQGSYDTQLQAVLTDLNANNGLACSDLGAFINHVKAQSGKQLSTAQASQLIADATSLQATIGC